MNIYITYDKFDLGRDYVFDTLYIKIKTSIHQDT